MIGTTILIGLPIKNVNAQEGDFLLTVSPSRVTIGADGTARYSVRITSIGGFTGTVQLQVTNLPSPTKTIFQSSYSFQPAILQVAADSDAYSILTLVVSAPTYTYTYYTYYPSTESTYYYYQRVYDLKFNIVATSSGISKSVPLDADVLYGYTANVRRDLTVDLQPGSIVLSGGISQAQQQTLAITVSAVNVQGASNLVFIVTPTLYDPPNGLSASFSPVTGQVQADQPLSFTANLLMTPELLQHSGTYKLAIGITAVVPSTGTYYSYYRNILLTKVAILTVLVPPFFTISANPSILNVYIGGQDQRMQIIISSVSRGFSQPITLTVQGVPPGVVATFETNILTPKGGGQLSTNLVLNAPSTFTSGIYPIQISATALGVTQVTNASIYLRPQGDYSLTLDQTTLALNARGESRTVTMNIVPQTGFRSTIVLSVAQLPTGVTATLSTANVTVQSDDPIPIVLTLTAQSNAAPGTYNVAVLSNTGFSQKTVTMTVLIRTGTIEMWPVVLVVVILIAVVSAIAFLAIPRRKHVHVVSGDMVPLEQDIEELLGRRQLPERRRLPERVRARRKRT